LEHLLAGGPVSQAARNLGIPVQTAHSRMMTIRQMMGHALEDPNQRFELIIALRAALPRWRTESWFRSQLRASAAIELTMSGDGLATDRRLSVSAYCPTGIRKIRRVHNRTPKRSGCRAPACSW